MSLFKLIYLLSKKFIYLRDAYTSNDIWESSLSTLLTTDELQYLILYHEG